MRRLLLTIPLALLAACDVGLGTGPTEVTLSDLSDPAPNSAVVLLTKALGDGRGYSDMAAASQYGYTLRTPPPLPRLDFDTQIGLGESSLLLTLADIDRTGVLTTGTDGVAIRFVAPDGSIFEPVTTCRITITSAWEDRAGARLQGRSDCPATDGEIVLRVLFKFDYTVPAG